MNTAQFISIFNSGGNPLGPFQERVAADGGTVEGLDNMLAKYDASASWQLIPSAVKAGTAYAQVPNTSVGDLTVTRASSGTFTNSAGVVQTAASNVLRTDYRNADGTLSATGRYLLEPQRTNNFTQSESFANYYVNRSTATDLGTPPFITSGSIARFTATAAQAFFGKFANLSAGIVYSWSAYFDLSQGIYAGIQDASGNYRIFNMQTGTVVGSGAGTLSITCNSHRIGTSNYYRITFTFTATISGNYFWVIGLSDGTNATTNQTVAAGYFQNETGAYATSYIPTTTAAVTRLADSFTRNNIYTNGLISSAGGTWFAELNNNIVYNSTGFLRFGIGETNTLSTNSLIIRTTGTSRTIISKIVGGAATQLYATLTDTVKIAIKWNVTTADVFINGVKQINGTSFTTTNMEFFTGEVNAPLYMQQMLFASTPLSDAQCIQLTTL